MSPLKTILQSKKVLALLTLIVMIYVIILNGFPTNSHYKEETITLIVIVESYTIKENQVAIEGMADEPILIYGTLASEKEKQQFETIAVGDKLRITGTLRELSRQTYPNLFSYKDYAKTKGIFYMMELSSYQKVGTTWRTYLYKWLHKYEWKYMDTYLFMNTSILPSSFKEVNWLPLFSIYSIHLRPFKRYSFLFLFLLLLLLLTTNFAPKIFSLLLLFYLRRHHISFPVSLYLSLLFRLFLEPKIILTFSFLYLVVIYGTIIIIVWKKWKNQIFVSYLLNFMTLPIFIFQNYYFNPLLFFLQPFIFYMISLGFIGTLINCLIPFRFILDPYFNILTMISEYLSHLSFFKISFAKLPIPFFIVCYFLLFLCFFGIVKKKVRYMIPIIIFCILHHLIPTLISYQDIFYLDVGQGDAILIRMDKKNILIDSGGMMGIEKVEEEQTEKMIKNKMIPFFRSLGITKLDYVIITHGDYDHIGGMNTIIEEFPIKTVLFNSNDYNQKEMNLLKQLDQKKISYNRITNAKIETKNSIISLFSIPMEDENEASIITSLKYENRIFLFLSDATIETTEKYISVANLSNIEILKVSHHGSKNNTNEEIIQKLLPKYAIFSAGRNNLYHHPSPVITNLLERYHIPYLSTQTEGTIHFFIKKRVFQTNPA